jgi:hypothetical protein
VDFIMTFLHGVALAAGFFIISKAIAWFTGRGSFGAQAAYGRACKDLNHNGRTSIQANLFARLCGTGPIALDAQGFAFSQGFAFRKSTTLLAYAWSEIQKPLSIESTGQTSHDIVFFVLRRNKNFGKRRIFANTKDEFVLIRGQLPCSYSTGQTGLLELMNRLRNHAFAGAAENAERSSFPILYEGAG